MHIQVCTFPCGKGTADGDFDGVLDPMAGNAGCFDPRRSYDDVVWTYPVAC